MDFDGYEIKSIEFNIAWISACTDRIHLLRLIDELDGYTDLSIADARRDAEQDCGRKWQLILRN